MTDLKDIIANSTKKYPFVIYSILIAVIVIILLISLDIIYFGKYKLTAVTILGSSSLIFFASHIYFRVISIDTI